MVIGNDFVWLHMGKTGGNSTKLMFDILTGITYSDSIHDPAKHLNINRVDIDQSLLQNRKIICNIRMLPAWIKSFKEQIIITRKKTLTLDELCNSAESHIKSYTTTNIDHWLRTEHLTDDFIKIMSMYVEIKQCNVIKLNKYI